MLAILAVVFILQKSGGKLVNLYADYSGIFSDIGYTPCAQSDFKLAGCEKYFKLGEQVCAAHYAPSELKGCEWYVEAEKEFFNSTGKTRSQVMNGSSWKFIDTSKLVKLADWRGGITESIGCRWIPAGWYAGRQTLFVLCNTILSNFHPGGNLNWLKLANLPVLDELGKSYNQIVVDSKEARIKAEKEIEKKIYPDLKIKSISLVSKLEPAPVIDWAADKQIVFKDEALVFSWNALNATKCELNGKQYGVKDSHRFLVNEEFKITLTCYGNGTYRTVRLDVPIGIRFISDDYYGKKLGTLPTGPGEEIRNKIKITIENNSNVETNGVELRYIPAGHFYPLAISGVYYSDADLAPVYQKEKEKIDGVEHTITSEAVESPNRFVKRDYMKNIDNEDVQKYCLNDFVHWDKREVAKRENFCLTANIKATTTLMGKTVGMSGVDWLGGLPSPDFNRSNGSMPFPWFNRNWQEWTIKYFEKSLQKTPKVSGPVRSPYSPFANEIEDGSMLAEKIEHPQIVFSKGGGSDWNPKISVHLESLKPNSKQEVELYVKLPWCNWKAGYTCDPNAIQYGYWVLLPWGHKSYDENARDNFYFKNRVDLVKNMVLDNDIDKWLKKDPARSKWPWTVIEYVYSTGIVIFADMPLRY